MRYLGHDSSNYLAFFIAVYIYKAKLKSTSLVVMNAQYFCNSDLGCPKLKHLENEEHTLSGHLVHYTIFIHSWGMIYLVHWMRQGLCRKRSYMIMWLKTNNNAHTGRGWIKVSCVFQQHIRAGQKWGLSKKKTKNSFNQNSKLMTFFIEIFWTAQPDFNEVA